MIENANRDEGQALIIVMGILLALTLFAFSLVTIVTNRENATFNNIQYHQAQAAAQFGMAEFFTFLNFYPSLPNTCYTTSLCTNKLGVPNTTDEYFELSVNPYPCSGNPCITHVTSTGYVGGARASTTVTLSRGANAYLQFIYYTNYETADPADSEVFCGFGCGPGGLPYSDTNSSQCRNNGLPSSGCGAQQLCPYHVYDKNKYTGKRGPDYNAGCLQIEFGQNDVINGPLFTNDDATICQATFNSTVQTGDPNSSDSPFYKNPGCGPPNFSNGGFQETQFVPPPPANNNSTKIFAQLSGCAYFGPTLVTLHTNDTATIISPDTKSFPGGFFSSQSGACGTPGPASSGGCLDTVSGCTINLAATGCGYSVCFDGVIYVENSPTSSTDPNYWSETVSGGVITSSAPTCNNQPFSLQIGQEAVAANSVPNTNPANCLAGDLLIQGDPNATTTAYVAPNTTQSVFGAFNADLTASAQNNVIIVGNLAYGNGLSSNSSDDLGLVANNFIEVNNPTNVNSCSPNSNYYISPLGQYIPNLVVDAALLAGQHSFTPINWSTNTVCNPGASGFLNITGSIAQDFRGIVAYVGQTGWNKDYIWDSRLVQYPPPYFPTPPWLIEGIQQN
jgi:hypothetical protein